MWYRSVLSRSSSACRQVEHRWSSHSSTQTSWRPQPAFVNRSSTSWSVHLAQKLLLVHLVAALLPDFSQVLQDSPNLLAWCDAYFAEVVPTNGEARDDPSFHLIQQLSLTLILQELTNLQLNIWLPGLKRENKGTSNYALWRIIKYNNEMSRSLIPRLLMHLYTSKPLNKCLLDQYCFFVCSVHNRGTVLFSGRWWFHIFTYLFVEVCPSINQWILW